MDWEDSKDRPVPVTPWSVVHFAFGFIFAQLTEKFGFHRSLVTLIVIHTLYEIKDTLYSKSSLLNSVFDELFALAGFIFFYKFQTPSWILAVLTILYITSPLSSKNGTWTYDIWNSRG